MKASDVEHVLEAVAACFRLGDKYQYTKGQAQMFVLSIDPNTVAKSINRADAIERRAKGRR